ncbi:hypothetical protein QYE76_017985 [Lolium multiflorum]|uniref:Reverse transcriptase zinc-binding domain-containing protein n=1 Tax=Lolium multiflorum TaxID=4521 RepID=A0AAD8QI19_LOLMU|nr:hypothetical protein QYE76_017981 [Lolium multiflorum]KAK1602650.1 hypothetical protein QYE76_017985 [Lolium multiflorum]
MDEAALSEFFLLWQRLANIQLDPEREDVLLWRWSTDDIYSAKLAYEAFFAGQVRASVSEQIWRSRAPYSCKFFAWLASKNRCWTEGFDIGVCRVCRSVRFAIRSQRPCST